MEVPVALHGYSIEAGCAADYGALLVEGKPIRRLHWGWRLLVGSAGLPSQTQSEFARIGEHISQPTIDITLRLRIGLVVRLFIQRAVLKWLSCIAIPAA